MTDCADGPLRDVDSGCVLDVPKELDGGLHLNQGCVETESSGPTHHHHQE